MVKMFYHLQGSQNYAAMSFCCDLLNQSPIYVHDQFTDIIILAECIEDYGDHQYIWYKDRMYPVYSDGVKMFYASVDAMNPTEPAREGKK